MLKKRTQSLTQMLKAPFTRLQRYPSAFELSVEDSSRNKSRSLDGAAVDYLELQPGFVSGHSSAANRKGRKEESLAKVPWRALETMRIGCHARIRHRVRLAPQQSGNLEEGSWKQADADGCGITR